ncbi:MAG: hypothetical protein KF857_05580 [Fimbriimonadaceae bacterium]|nr:hypothetical protein [Fimbriimonadaceae bacterium]
MIVIVAVIIVGVLAAMLVKGGGGETTIGDKNTLPPQLKAAYGVSDGKSPTSQSQNPGQR